MLLIRAVLSRVRNLPASGMACHDRDRWALAGAVLASQRVDLARGEGKGNVVDGAKGSLSLLVNLDSTLHGPGEPYHNSF